MKLNWFSPLPPAETDIAHYTKRLLPALSSVAEVTLWTNQPNWERELQKFARVRRYQLNRLPWVELNRADMTFYQIGNNPRFHGAIWQISRLHAGVIVLHDFRLHHFFDGLYRVERRDRDSYLALMERYYGKQGRLDAAQSYANEAPNIAYMAEKYPLTNLALENALGVLVHSRDSFDSLERNQQWPMAYAPLPFPSEMTNIAAAQRNRKSVDAPHRLVLFGYIGRNRRLESVFQALAGMPERHRFHLDIFGHILDDESLIRARVNSLNLKDLVTIHGFASESQLDKALSRSELAINLRFPTVEEASGSQLRIWAHALPSLVSRAGWFASLSSEMVCFVRTDENEIGDIQKWLRAFLADPGSFAKSGQRGRKELEDSHSPDAYAQAVLEIGMHAMSFRRQAASLTLAERAAKKASVWLDQQLVDETFPRIAAEVFEMAGKR